MTEPAAAALFNIDAFEDATVGDLPITHPITGKPTGMVVHLAGPEHPVRRQLVLQRQRRMRAQLAQTGQMPTVTDPEEDEAEDFEFSLACVLGWSGAAQTYSPELARAHLADPRRRWLKEQVQAGLRNRQLFTRSSAPA